MHRLQWCQLRIERTAAAGKTHTTNGGEAQAARSDRRAAATTNRQNKACRSVNPDIPPVWEEDGPTGCYPAEGRSTPQAPRRPLCIVRVSCDCREDLNRGGIVEDRGDLKARERRWIRGILRYRGIFPCKRRAVGRSRGCDEPTPKPPGRRRVGGGWGGGGGGRLWGRAFFAAPQSPPADAPPVGPKSGQSKGGFRFSSACRPESVKVPVC